jgi:N-methylhydantoinase A
VQPLMVGYLGRLDNSLKDLGVKGRLYVMLSGGGIATVEQAQAFPIQLIESGPAAGAMAASHYGALIGESDLISFDMGGTTAKMCLIEGGRPQRTHNFEAGRVKRFKKGSGLPLKVSVVDMIEIGAGGGSIASIDAMGLLKVGPHSAGSEPGPVAYGRGGKEPTVTDADLLLGYLNPDFFLGGEMSLDAGQVENALRDAIAEPLEMTPIDAAIGVHRVVNENMASATRRYLAEKGKDPRRYSMIAFGGAGPVHAYALARLLKIPRLIVPFGAGVTSALGFLVAPPAVDDVRSYVSRIETTDWDTVNKLYAEMEQSARRRLVTAGADADTIVFERRAEMRHVGQGFEIEVPVVDGALSETSAERIREAFFATYFELFERNVTEVGIEVMSWRLGASAPPRHIPLNFRSIGTQEKESLRGHRNVHFAEHGTVSAAVYDRYALSAGQAFSGPAVVEERESTTVIGPGAQVNVDEHLNLIIDIA